ncbi:MAG: hypothetical protein H7Y11_04265 [Armatimonadetes bacterium]|nr:hypothetical protein [Anaerolineae bacterium]
MPTSPEARGPFLWSLVLIVIGGALLLDNFLLLGDFEVTRLLPLVLVVAGAQLVLRGDLMPSSAVRPFSITRGSVESGTLEISAGEIDVQVRGLQREGRLVAGQFAADARPQLAVDGAHTTLRFLRAAAPWYALGDWQVALARDLPWQVFISTHVGQVDVDLSEIILQAGVIASGIGDVRVVCPAEAFGALHIQSALGAIQFITPVGYTAQVTVQTGAFFGVKLDTARYTQTAPHVYLATGADPDIAPVEVFISGTFGDAYLA